MMAKYIDLEALEKAMTIAAANGKDKDRRTWAKAICVLHDMPTADVAPVVHGRWEWFDEETGTPLTGYEREWGWRCSHCNHELPDDYDDPDYRPMLDYCFNCGAKMDGGEENG
jgi:hypothetical protein